MGKLVTRLGRERVARALWGITAPHDDWDEYDKRAKFWITYDDGQPVAFGALRPLRTSENYLFLAAAGVLKEYRGHGLQRELIRRRVNWAYRHGYDGLITYVALNNIPSLVNLLRQDFRFYRPDNKWVGDGFHYLMYRFKRADRGQHRT